MTLYEITGELLELQNMIEEGADSDETKAETDTISRQAAIALADSLKDELPDDERAAYCVMAHNEGILEYQTALSLLPSAQPEPQWTPCSEGKPKKTGYYICTCHDGVCCRTSALKWSNGWILTGARSYWKVIAWMPLPEPYKKG